MTMPIQFDSLEYAKTLQAAGIPAEQAEAHAQALITALSGAVVVPSEMVVFKADLLSRFDLFKQEINARFDLFKQELNARFDLFKQEIETRLDQFEQKIEARLDQFEQKVEARLDQLNLRLTALERSVRGLRVLLLTSLLCNLGTGAAVVLLLGRH
ncbi:MAG: hypothetical protein ACEQSK_03040 [Sphingomonadaceae bacterium]